MRLIIFEGTAEEFKAAEHLLGTRQPQDNSMSQVGDGTTTPDNQYHELILRVLRRIPIPRGQRDLFKVLISAGDQGISKSDLAEAMQRTPQELTGVLGALGHRISRTEGTPVDPDRQGIYLFFVIKQVNGEWHYTMRPEVREIIQEEGAL